VELLSRSDALPVAAATVVHVSVGRQPQTAA
jgi:hypothetical protein